MKDKIGAVVITYNSQEYFETLFNSLPVGKDYELVVVNGGEPYNKTYKRIDGEIHWVQHDKNYGSAKSRNDGLKKLYELGCDHMYVIEDDLIIKSEDIFDEYINASRVTGLEYFCFASYAWGVGNPDKRTPVIQVQYSPELSINLNRNTTNEFTYRSKRVFEEVGYYNEEFKNMFDIEWVYRVSKTDYAPGFWYFPDLSNSDELIMNNPVAVSRLDPNVNRWEKLQNEYQQFENIYGTKLQKVPVEEQEKIIKKLINLKLSLI